jgi:hypothetical protein
VHKFTEAAQEGGGDYTVAFWVRPTGSASLNAAAAGGEKFIPQAHFFASLSPPTHNLGVIHTHMCSMA